MGSVLLWAADGGQLSALCLLDMTAAFDTVDHNNLLLFRLERQFGLHGVVLSWFRSYLTDRSVCVAHDGRISSTVLSCSVPQGSVLGPRLFILYLADLADKAEEHDTACFHR